MAKLYGKGTITELVKGKKYRIALSGGKDPLSGRVYTAPQTIPDNAYALDSDGKAVTPRITYRTASDGEKTAYPQWKTPVTYLRHQETFLGTKRQAELRIEQIRREMENGKRPDADKITFSDWCEGYLSTREKMAKCRPKTLKQDRSNSKHLVSALGGVCVADITPAAIENLYASLRESGKGDTTILQCHRLLRRILANAMDNDIITRNPADRVETPRKPKPERHAMSAEDSRRFVEACTSDDAGAYGICAFLGLALGARLGEVLGLTWGHVAMNAERPHVCIIQQHTQDGTRTALKTDRDDNPLGRVVPIDGATVGVLSRWRERQRAELSRLGIVPDESTPIITNSVGNWVVHSDFQRWWRSFCVSHGFGEWVAEDGRRVVTLAIGESADAFEGCIIEWRDSSGWPCDESGKRYSRSYPRPSFKRSYRGLHFHELRHTHFTMRLADGMDIPTAQALGGWTTPETLMTVYAHPTPENVWASAGFMDALTA